MKELDFDELDRAVNSLMDSVPKTEPTKADDTKTLTINSTLPDGAAPKFDASAATPAASPAPSAPAQPTVPAPSAPATPATPPAGRRGGGRFMDVVHPSSNMKPQAPARTVSRQGATIEPRGPVASATPAPSAMPPVAPVSPEPETEKTPVAEPASEPQPTPAAGDWPDPLEMGAPAEATNVSSVPEVDAPATVIEPEDPVASPAPDTEPAPLTTPFLTDAKVEKRPLGGAPAPVSDTVEEPDHSPVLGVLADTSESDTADDKSDAQLPPKAIEAEPLPEELNGELMAIESDSSGDQAAAEEADAAPAPAAPVEPAAPAASVSAPTVPGGGSITQQYKEEPNSGDQTNGGIYDTAAYHQPLAHPAQKKSGWLWVLGIVIIVLLGAGIGAALYFLGIV